ncbi:glycosyltransferase family 4 protein [Candidatus Kaiserbacteria bacterium]|nr:glycosyltransferase family 4 protein [Candidatus Kaiserbacteria bacterium]
MNIAVLHDNFPPHSVGGADIIAYNLAREYHRNGHTVLVITTTRDAARAGVTQVNGLTVHTIATSYDLRFQAYVSLWNIPVVAKVQRILADWKPEVVHAHNVHGYLSYRSLVVAKKLGARVILTVHDVMSFNYQKLTDFIDPADLSVPTTFNYRVSAWRQLVTNRFRYNPLRNLLIRRILEKNVDRIVTVSDALRQALSDNGIGNTQTIHNGIDVAEWEEPAENVAAFKRAHGVGDAAMFFGGRLSGVKGAANLIKALALVTKTVPEAQLLAVGQKDAYAKKMLALAHELGIADKILFTGWLSGHQLHQAHHAAAVVVVPSLCFDSFPTMNIEGMACKKPVVATCFGGSREAVVDDITGFINNPFDVPTIAAKLVDLLHDTAKRTAFGEAGYQRVREQFPLTQQVEAYQQLFAICK